MKRQGHKQRIIGRSALKLSGPRLSQDESPPVQKNKQGFKNQGKATREHHATTYLNTLLLDTGIQNVKAMEKCMDNRDTWC